MPFNVFLSFTTEDKDLVELFRGQARNKHLDLEFRDYSIKEPFDYSWKTNCEKIIRECSATICLIGKGTYRSDAVDWEIRKSVELGKGVMAIYLGTDSVVLPRVLRELKITPVLWEINAFMKELQQVAR